MASKPKKPRLLSLFIFLSFLVFSAIALPLVPESEPSIRPVDPSTPPEKSFKDPRDATPSKRSEHYESESENVISIQVMPTFFLDVETPSKRSEHTPETENGNFNKMMPTILPMDTTTSKRSEQHESHSKNDNINMMIPTALIEHVSEQTSTHGPNLDSFYAISIPTKLPSGTKAQPNSANISPRSPAPSEGSIYPIGAAEVIQAQSLNSGAPNHFTALHASIKSPVPKLEDSTPQLEQRRLRREESIWSSVMFVIPGERVPSLEVYNTDGNLEDAPLTLTEKGVRQMRQIGKVFRRRYFPSRHMHDYVPDDIHDDPNQSTKEERYLYDHYFFRHHNKTRLVNLSPHPLLHQEARLETLEINGSPESGLQFWGSMFEDHHPGIHTVSSYDPSFISLDATSNCVAHSSLRRSWTNSSVASSLADAKTWIDALDSDVDIKTFFHLLSENFPSLNVVGSEEFWIPENAGRVLETVRAECMRRIDGEEMQLRLNGTRVRGQEIYKVLEEVDAVVRFSLYGNLTAENMVGQGIGNVEAGNATRGSVSTIGGAALAKRVRDTLQANVEDEGRTSKLDVMVGEMEQLLSLLVLTNVSRPAEGVMMRPPGPGSVFAFELFSVTDPDEEGQVMPGQEWLKVRLVEGVMRHTARHSFMEPMGLFGDNGTKDGMPYSEFLDKMEGIALGGTGDWCLQCGNKADFCAAYDAQNKMTERIVEVIEVPVERKEKVKRQMKPAVAGVVGAVILFSMFTVAAGFLMGCLGMRCYRDRTKAMKGFKGNKRLGSGPGAGIRHPRDAVSRDANGGESWELTSPAKAFTKSRDSFDSGVKAATVAERV